VPYSGSYHGSLFFLYSLLDRYVTILHLIFAIVISRIFDQAYIQRQNVQAGQFHPLAACRCFPRLDRMRADMVPVLLSRCAMKDYGFSNGMTVPAGTRLAISTHKPHFDDQIYEDLKIFDGFRFYKLRQASRSKGELGRKLDMT